MISCQEDLRSICIDFLELSRIDLGSTPDQPWMSPYAFLMEICQGPRKRKSFNCMDNASNGNLVPPKDPPGAPQDPKDLSGSPQGMPNGPARCSPGAPRAPRVWKGGQPGPPPEELLQSSGPHREKISSPQKKTDPGVYVKPKEFVFTDTKTRRCIRKTQGIPKEFVYTDTKKH